MKTKYIKVKLYPLTYWVNGYHIDKFNDSSQLGKMQLAVLILNTKKNEIIKNHFDLESIIDSYFEQ
jgi:hypothetical protein